MRVMALTVRHRPGCARGTRPPGKGRGRRRRADTGAMTQHRLAYLSPSAPPVWEYLELPLAPLVWQDLEPSSDAGTDQGEPGR